jgi:hypothetical protein
MKRTLAEIQAVLFTAQFARLYITSKYRETFLIQVLPEGEKAKPNGDVNPCLNTNAVKVFEWRQGQATSFKNSWLFKGKWQEDFNNLVEDLISKEEARAKEQTAREKAEAEAETQAQLNLLATYK